MSRIHRLPPLMSLSSVLPSPESRARRTAARLVLAVPVLAVAVACGGTSTSTAPNAPATQSSTPASPGSSAPGNTNEAPTPAPVAQTAGPITATATVCTVEGAPLKGGTSVVSSLAFSKDHAFIAGDEKVLAFTVAADANSCTLALDTGLDPKIAKDGALDIGTVPMDTVSATPTGRVVTSGVLGTKVFDLDKGTSYVCDDVTGNVIVHPSGTYAYRWFPGSPVKRIELGDTKCTPGPDVVLPFAEAQFVGFDGDAVLVGGKDASDVVTAAKVVDGTPVWQHSNPEASAEDTLGWVHGMAKCGDRYCTADTNFDRTLVLGADGAHQASFPMSKMLGLPRGFVQTMVPGPDGAPYVLDSVTDGDSTFGFVARIDVTG